MSVERPKKTRRKLTPPPAPPTSFTIPPPPPLASRDESASAKKPRRPDTIALSKKPTPDYSRSDILFYVLRGLRLDVQETWTALQSLEWTKAAKNSSEKERRLHEALSDAQNGLLRVARGMRKKLPRHAPGLWLACGVEHLAAVIDVQYGLSHPYGRTGFPAPFHALLQRLRAVEVSFPDIAELILMSSRDWNPPPCPCFVEHFENGGVRELERWLNTRKSQVEHKDARLRRTPPSGWDDSFVIEIRRPAEPEPLMFPFLSTEPRRSRRRDR